MKKEARTFKQAMIILGMFAVMSGFVFGAIGGPGGAQTITRIQDERFDPNNYAPGSLPAEAGNVTQISIAGLSQTKSWQGFYGEVTGTITLDDADGWTMYDWYEAEPAGEVYATPNLVTNWHTLRCFNYSNDGYSGNFSYIYDGVTKWTVDNNPLNLVELENDSSGLFFSLGVLHQDGTEDGDGVDETFNITGDINNGTTSEPHKGFTAGLITIEAGSCPATDTYEVWCMRINGTRDEWVPVDPSLLNSTSYCYNESWKNGSVDGNLYEWKSSWWGNSFQEVLLTTNNSNNIIYATIIENDEYLSGSTSINKTDIIGFDNQTHDFQIIVGVNGHNESNPHYLVTYYFYVELS